MIEKFFGTERIFMSFLITIFLVAIVNIILHKIGGEAEDPIILVFTGIVFVLVKLMYANYDLYKDKDNNENNKK